MKKILITALILSALLCTACGKSQNSSANSNDSQSDTVSQSTESSAEEQSSESVSDSESSTDDESVVDNESSTDDESVADDESSTGNKSPVISLNAGIFFGEWVSDNRSYTFYIDGNGSVKDNNSDSEKDFTYKLSGDELTLTYSDETAERASVEVIDEDNIIFKWESGNKEALKLYAIGEFPEIIGE